MHEDAWQHINNCLHCKNPQCVKGCPVKFDIPSFLQQAKQGDFDAAVKTVGHLFGEVCGYIYDPQLGDPDNGIEPGTAFEDLPEDWVCPLCQEGKEVFEPID